MTTIKAQVFEVDTLKYNGDINKYINIVIMGDGYTATQQDSFISNTNNLSNYIFSIAPWSNYKGYFNVFAIKVISPESGISHPGTATDVTEPVFPVATVNNYFNTTFDYAGIHRLIVPQNTAKISNVLAANFPNYDQVLIIANSTYYGGSGGEVATSSINASSDEITAHEMGHSFAGLADEYYAGDGYFAEKPNMTQQTNTTLVKWKNWLGYNNIGIKQYCCSGNSALWYKPTTNACKMEFLNYPYCSVCNQTIIESIHDLVNPIISYTPTASVINSSTQLLGFELTELMIPNPNTLNMEWKLDNSIISHSPDSVQIDPNNISFGTHSLVVTVTDTTNLIRIDNHAAIHFSTVTWTIQKGPVGIDLQSKSNKISYSVYPNPTNQFLNITLEIEQKSQIAIQLVSLDGKVIQQIENTNLEGGKLTKRINLEQLTSGIYFLEFNIDNASHTEKIIKQ